MEKWIWLGLPVAAFLALSLCLLWKRGTAFLGKISLCLAGWFACWMGIGWLGVCAPLPAKILGALLSGGTALGFAMAVAAAIPIAKMARRKETAACAYVVVLGAKMQGSAPSPAMQRRIRRAYDYLCQYPDTIAILSGGKGSGDSISEAECMFRELQALGMESRRLLLEEQAASTWENFRFSLEMLEAHTGARPGRLGLISSETHLYRASLFAKQWGVAVVPIPARTEKPLQFINDYLREIAGVWHYFILGGRYHD